MTDTTVSFEELVEYSFDAIEEETYPHKHDITHNSVVFLHEDGKHYRGWFYTSYNEGAMEEMGYGIEEVKPVERIVVEWVGIDENVKEIS